MGWLAVLEDNAAAAAAAAAEASFTALEAAAAASAIFVGGTEDETGQDDTARATRVAAVESLYPLGAVDEDGGSIADCEDVDELSSLSEESTECWDNPLGEDTPRSFDKRRWRSEEVSESESESSNAQGRQSNLREFEGTWSADAVAG